jgi:hypothetical protein
MLHCECHSPERATGFLPSFRRAYSANMTTTKHMRTVLAAAAAGALVLGSAGGAIAKGKPDTVPSQKGDRLVSVSIKGHAPIDIADFASLPEGAGIPLRAKLWDPKRDSAATTVSVTVGLFTKKVRGSVFQVAGGDAPPATAVPLVLDAADAKRKVKDYRATAVLKGAGAVWTPEQLTAVGVELAPDERAYICISSVEVSPTTPFSTKVKKRTTTVRDCVKLIDTTP